MSDANAELINGFYRAFQRQDAEAMAACYAPDVQFSDPVFIDLNGREAADMWRMLCSRAQDFSLSFSAV
jgi:ketosteroid isomerase-like protein